MTTAAATPVAAAAAASRPVTVPVVMALVEGRRLARHPLVLVAAALSLWIGLAARADIDVYVAVLTFGVVPLMSTALVAANLAALRAGRSGTVELLGTLPASASQRTAGHLLAAVAPALLGLAVTVALWFARGLGDGLWLRSPYGRTLVRPALAELLQGPLVVLAGGVFGVLLARWLPSRVLAAVCVVVLLFVNMIVVGWFFAGPNRWLAPLANPLVTSWADGCEAGTECQVLEDVESTSAAWHLLYVAALTAVLGLLALLCDGRSRARLLALAAAAAFTAVVGVVQLP